MIGDAGLLYSCALAWDWIAGNLYIADCKLGKISLYSTESQKQCGIINDGIQDLGVLAVDPTNG